MINRTRGRLTPAANSTVLRDQAALPFTPDAGADIITVSVRSLKRAKMVELVRTARDTRTQEIGFSSRPFVLSGLPIKRPPKAVTLYTRRNGNFILDIQAHARWGLPFGQDRLIPIWIATVALKTGSPVIRFKSAAEILDTFGLPKDGKTYRRLVEGFKRIFGATFFFGIEQKADITALDRFNYFSRMRLWYAPAVEQQTLEGVQNEIVLSDQFWAELKRHPIPVDLAVVKALADSPGATDFYVWVCWRSWKARGPVSIPLFGHTGLKGQLGVQGYDRKRKFRDTIKRWIAVTRLHWPQCPVELSADGDYLVISSGRALSGA